MKWGILCDCIEELWPSLVGPELETGTTVGKLTDPDPSWLVARSFSLASWAGS